jgi:lipopolysaccharide transport system permease protein
LVVPIAVVISNLLRFVIQVGLFVALYLYFFVNGAPIAPNWAILLTPVFIVMLAGLGLGLGILISSLTTKYRDFSILFTFIVHLWMYATPIVYPISMVEEGTLRTLIMANPMTSIIEAFKYATLGQGYFSWFALGYSFLFMSVLLLFSVVIFNKVQRNFMDTV